MSVKFSPWLVLLALLTAVGPMSIDMYLPSFQALEAELGESGGSAEWTLATFFIGLALGQLAYGPLSDRYGRKPPLYFGLAIYTLAALGCSTADSLYGLMGWRFLQGLGGCAGMVIARASVRDRLEGNQAAEAFSLMVLVMGLAPMLAPLAGGWVLKWFGWRAIFGVLAVFGLLLIAGVRFVLDETRAPVASSFSSVVATYRTLLADREFMTYTLLGGLLAAGMFAYISGSPEVFMQVHEIPAERYGMLFGLNALGFVIASQINVRLLRRFQSRQLLHAGTIAAVVSVSVMLLAELRGGAPLPVLAAGIFCYLLSLGFTNPNSTALALASQKQNAGAASALLGTLQFLLGTVSGAVLGALSTGTALPLVAIMALCAGTALVLLHKLPAPMRFAAAT
jgi:MFS transporter, DHA1 family, multidrug resistance protein